MLLRSRRSPSRRYHVAPSFRGTDSSSEQLERIACAGRGQGGPPKAEGLAPERDASTARPTYGPTRNRTENLLIKSRDARRDQRTLGGANGYNSSGLGGRRDLPRTRRPLGNLSTTRPGLTQGP